MATRHEVLSSEIESLRQTHKEVEEERAAGVLRIASGYNHAPVLSYEDHLRMLYESIEERIAELEKQQ